MRKTGWTATLALLIAAPVLAGAGAVPQAPTKLQRCLLECKVVDIECQKTASGEGARKACVAAKARCEADCRKAPRK